MTADESSSEPHATFRVGAGSRWLHAITLVVLAVMTIAMAGAAGWSGILALFLALTFVEAMNAVALWRWKVTSDDVGVTVRQGLGPPRHVPWEAITSVRRTLPPTVEVVDGEPVRLGAAVPRSLLRRTAEHIDAHAARPPETDHQG